MFGLSLSEILVVVLGLITIIKVVLEVYKGVSNPNNRQDLRLQRVEDTCKIRSKTVDEYLLKLDNGMALIKDNHLKHIEENINNINNRLSRLETLLEERLPRK